MATKSRAVGYAAQGPAPTFQDAPEGPTQGHRELQCPALKPPGLSSDRDPTQGTVGIRGAGPDRETLPQLPTGMRERGALQLRCRTVLPVANIT